MNISVFVKKDCVLCQVQNGTQKRSMNLFRLVFLKFVTNASQFSVEDVQQQIKIFLEQKGPLKR